MNGIGEFVSGVFEGMDWREARDDRKRMRKIEDDDRARRQKFEDEDAAWARESRGRQRTEWGRADTAYDRGEAERQAELDAWNLTVDEMMRGGGTPAVTPAPAQVQAPAQAVTPDQLPIRPSQPLSYGQPALSGGAGQPALAGGAGRDALANTGGPVHVAPQPAPDVVPVPVAPAGIVMEPAIAQARAATAVNPQTAAPPPPSAPPTSIAPMTPVPVTDVRQIDAMSPQGALTLLREIMSGARSDVPAEVRTAAINKVVSAYGAGHPDVQTYQHMARDGFQRGRIAKQGRSGPATPPPANVTLPSPAFERTGRQTAPVPQPGAMMDPSLMRQSGTPAPQVQQQAPQAALDTATRAVAGGFEGGGRSSQPSDKAISPSAAVPAQQAAAPSAGKKVADRADLSFGIIGTAVKVPSSEYRAVETRGVEAYRQQKLAPIVEHYLRTGQPEKAAAFEKFLADKRTQEGMKSWLKAAHAYNMGDKDGFIDGIVGAYNSYFDDGYTAVKEKSEFERDGNGNITRAKIAFRNDETGEITYQVFEDTRDVVVAALGGLEPSAAFETLYGMTFGAKQPDKPKMPTFDQITDAVQKRAMMDPGFAALPYDQQLDLMTRAAMAVAQGQSAAPAGAGGDVPLADPDQ